MTTTQQTPEVDDITKYVNGVPTAARTQFDKLRAIVRTTAPDAKEVFSYGILGYKIDEHRARVFVSGWKDHVAMYPVPSDEALQVDLAPYIQGKGTLWFPLDKPLPKELLKRTVEKLVS